jgi:hypothetical protein
MTVSVAVPPRSTTSTASRTATRQGGTGATRTRSAAVQRAYARRAQRAGALPAGQGPAAANRVPFVVLVMVLLSAALVTTLWLSTAAAADSYRLKTAREVTRDLTEHAEQLGREVAGVETAPELARRAAELGMVPAGDPARLVVGPDGTVALVGQPKAATAPGTPVPVPAVAQQAAAAQPLSSPAASAWSGSNQSGPVLLTPAGEPGDAG